MVQVWVRELANERGSTTIPERAELTDTPARALWHGRLQRIDRDVLGRVCTVLSSPQKTS